MTIDDREHWNDLLARLTARAPAASRYQIGQEIGHGGMGAVFEINDPDLRRGLAMKVLRHEPTDRAVARFLEEAQIAAQLDHPGIVPIHELGVDSEGRVYFTMKRVRGDDLREVFAKVRAGDDGWNQPRALGVLLRVCEAMAFAHSRGVVHRDLKPANIMHGRFGETYVMDWGLAHVFDDSHRSAVHTDRHDLSHAEPSSPLLTQAGVVIGTATYMPPEQARGQTGRIDPRADVYALGATLYELLTGQPPYAAPHQALPAEVILQRLIAGPPTEITRLAPRAPAPLVAICNAAMARRIGDRYQTMEAFADDIRAYLENRVVKAHRTGPLIELAKWVQRNKAVAATVAALLVVLVGAGFFSAWHSQKRLEEVGLTADLREANELLSDGFTAAGGATAWLARAHRLDAATGLHRAALDALRARGRLLSDDEWGGRRDRHPLWGSLRFRQDFLAGLGGARAKREATLARAEATADERQRTQHELETLLHEDPEQKWLVRRWQAEMDGARWTFAEHSDQTRHDRLVDLLAKLELLGDPTHGVIARVEAMVERETRATSTAAESWRLTTDSIANRDECPLYSGFVIKPQNGLVPLARDQHSGLWEFWHPASGERPTRGANGSLQINPETGLVFVLVPGNRFTMGSQKDSPQQPNHDAQSLAEEGPPFEIDLAPFFLSKYEMTQGQWLRATSENPSGWFAGTSWQQFGVVTGASPVERVDWWACERVLHRYRLELPTEAQFECAVRGGTTTVFWWGDTSSGASANSMGIGDGFSIHAPVDAFTPNPFGFFCISGNVWEWCRDWFAARYAQTAPMPGDGLLDSPMTWRKAMRGGSYMSNVSALRCALRKPEYPDATSDSYGVRPARPVDR